MFLKNETCKNIYEYFISRKDSFSYQIHKMKIWIIIWSWNHPQLHKILQTVVDSIRHQAKLIIPSSSSETHRDLLRNEDITELVSRQLPKSNHPWICVVPGTDDCYHYYIQRRNPHRLGRRAQLRRPRDLSDAGLLSQQSWKNSQPLHRNRPPRKLIYFFFYHL